VSPKIFRFLSPFLPAALLAAPPAPRDWHPANSPPLSATLLGIERRSAILQNGSGARLTEPLDQLSAEDRADLEKWSAERTPQQRLAPIVWSEPPRLGPVQVRGPEKTADGFVFRTDHFEFRADAALTPALINDFAEVAEATVERFRALPLRLPEIQRDPYLVLLFRERSAFEAAGGRPSDAGKYRGGFPGEPGRLILPFESLGIEPFAGGFSKGRKYDNRILIHELGHELIGGTARMLPFWLNEGLAEYIALPRYFNGAFADAPRETLARLGERIAYYEHLSPRAFDPLTPAGRGASTKDWLVPLRDLFDPQLAANVNSLEQTHKIYLTALLLTWYLLHLDADGQASRIRAYFEQIGDAHDFFMSDGAIGRLPAGVSDGPFWRAGALRSVLEDGLFAGESPEDLQRDLVARYARQGLVLDFPKADGGGK
jgi:hypothetical protein